MAPVHREKNNFGAIVYTMSYELVGFTPFKGLSLASQEIIIGVEYDESPINLDKKVENININIYTKKLTRYTVTKFIANEEFNLITQSSTAGASSTSTSGSTLNRSA